MIICLRIIQEQFRIWSSPSFGRVDRRGGRRLNVVALEWFLVWWELCGWMLGQVQESQRRESSGRRAMNDWHLQTNRQRRPEAIHATARWPRMCRENQWGERREIGEGAWEVRSGEQRLAGTLTFLRFGEEFGQGKLATTGVVATACLAVLSDADGLPAGFDKRHDGYKKSLVRMGMEGASCKLLHEVVLGIRPDD